MQINNYKSNILIPSHGRESLSLAALVKEKLELVNFISRFSQCSSEDCSKIKRLAKKIICLSPKDSLIITLVPNLILRQFPRPQFDSVREVISNAMDAHARTGKNEPVIVIIQDDYLLVEDSGDGIQLINFFVPGRSANSRTLSNIQEAMSNVTGRFGQGGLSIFYYLYSTSTIQTDQPQFYTEKNDLILSFQCEIQGMKYLFKITAYGYENQVAINHEITILSRKDLPRLFIHSNNGKQAFKIKCQGENKIICLDIAERAKDTLGTKLKIHSPLIRSNKEELIEYVTNVFKSCKFPIKLNGSLIEEKYSKKLAFQGGTVSFTSLNDGEKDGGKLRLCECGKLISEFKLSRLYIVPNETTIDFERLTLSQERASIDFKSKQTQKEMNHLLETIAKSDALTAFERSALLNAITPVIDAGHFNLTSKLQELFAVMSVTTLKPNNSEKTASYTEDPLLENEDYSTPLLLNFASLNSEYLNFISLPIFYSGSNYSIYLNDIEKEPKVIFSENHYYVFLNKTWLPLGEPAVCKYNLFNLNQWLKYSGYLVSINVSAFCLQKFANISLDKKPLERPPLTLDFDINFDSYIIDKNEARSRLVKTFVELLPQYIYPDDIKWQTALRGLIIKSNQQLSQLYKDQYQISDDLIQEYSDARLHMDVSKIKIFTKFSENPEYQYYICDAYFSGKKCFEHIAANKNPDFQKIFENLVKTEFDIPTMHAILFAIHSFCKNLEIDEQEEYLKFMKYKVIFDLEDLYKLEGIFIQLQKIVRATGSQEKAIIKKMFKNFSCSDKTNMDYLLDLAKKIAHTDAVPIFLKKLNYLNDCQYCLSWPKEQLGRFFSIYPNRSCKLTEENYEHLYSLSLKKEAPKALLAKLASIYCYGSEICELIDVSPKSLLKLIKSYIQENRLPSLEDIDLIEATMKSAIDTIKKLTSAFLFPRNIIKINLNKSRFSFSDVTSNDHLMQKFKKWKEDKSLPFNHLSIEENIQKICYFTQIKSTHDFDALANFYRDYWEETGTLTPMVRPFFYALLQREGGGLKSEDFHWKWQFDVNACLLHKDSDLIHSLGSEEIAKNRLQGAILQTLQEYFFIKEFCKNSREAKAAKISIEVHSDKKGNTIIIFKDNGWGMDAEGLKILKVPNASSKEKDSDDPNFGWGFFTGFRDFEEIIVRSKKEGASVCCLGFKKTEEGIIREYFDEMEEEDGEVGTTFYLKSSKDPYLSLINLEAELASTCKYFKGVSITFQGREICKESNHNVFWKIQAEDISLEIGTGDEGIYCKDVLAGPLTSEYTNILPEPVRNYLIDQNLRIRIFLPHAKQVMNRSHLILDESTLLTAREFIIKLAFTVYVEQWSKIEGQTIDGKTIDIKNKEEKQKENHEWQKIFSDDCWNKFANFSPNPPNEIEKLNNYLYYGKLNFASTILDAKYKLIDYSRKLFEFYQTDHGLSTEMNHQLDLLSSALKSERQKAIQEMQKKHLQKLKDKFSRPDMFVNLISYYPLNEEGLTFMALRQKFKESLCAKNIILESGDYNIDLISSLKLNEVFSMIETIAREIIISCKGVGQNIIIKMVNKTCERCVVLYNQIAIRAKNYSKWHKRVLTDFFKHIALIWGRDVKIEYYSASDGKIAFVNDANPNVIFVNKKVFVKQFAEICHESKKPKLDDSEFIKLLSTMVETIVHECQHLEDGFGCQQTHDVRFKNNVAKKLSKMFIGKHSYFKSFEELSNILLEE